MPRPSEEELESFYRKAYQNPCTPHDPVGRVDIICDLVPSAGRVLDIGCGSGEILIEFARRGWNTVGIEPGHRYAETARMQGIDVIERPLTRDLIKELGTFDVVVLAHVLEHLPDPEDMLHIVRDLLSSGGFFYCEVPNDFNPLQEAAVVVQGLRPYWITLPDHLNYFTIATLTSFVESHCFEVLVKTTDFPLEMFLLWGDIYVDNPEVGRMIHSQRCRFEDSLRRAGQEKLLRSLYSKIAELGIGREAIVCARKLE